MASIEFKGKRLLTVHSTFYLTVVSAVTTVSDMLKYSSQTSFNLRFISNPVISQLKVHYKELQHRNEKHHKSQKSQENSTLTQHNTNLKFEFLPSQMVTSPGPLPHTVTTQTEQRSSEGTTTSCRTSMTRRRHLLTSAPRAVAAGTLCPPDRWSPPNRSV